MVICLLFVQMLKFYIEFVQVDRFYKLLGLLSFCIFDVVIGKIYVVLNFFFGNCDEDFDLIFVVENVNELLFVFIDLILLYQKFVG